MKPGLKSSEFALALLVAILGAVGPYLAAGSIWEKVVGLAVTCLASLGYTAGRSMVKSNEQKSLAAQAISKASSPSL